MTATREIPGTARFFVEQGSAEELIAWAQNTLELGYDSRSLLRLAVEDTSSFPPDVRRLFDAAVDELGIAPIDPAEGRLLWAQEIAQHLKDGLISPSTCASKVAGIFAGEDVSRDLGRWVDLDEMRNCEGCGYGADVAAPDLDAAIRRQAEELLSLGKQAPNSALQPTPTRAT